MLNRELIKELAVQAGFGYDQGNLLDPEYSQFLNAEIFKLTELVLSNAEAITRKED